MGDGSDNEPAVEAAPAGHDWARALAELCAVLARAAPGTVPALGATVRLDGRPGDLRLLLDTSQELGRRHGLGHTVRRAGATATYTVWFSRRPDRDRPGRH
jgi:hypothetical protein